MHIISFTEISNFTLILFCKWVHENRKGLIDEFTVIQSHNAEGANPCNSENNDIGHESTKQSNTTDKF